MCCDVGVADVLLAVLTGHVDGAGALLHNRTLKIVTRKVASQVKTRQDKKQAVRGRRRRMLLLPVCVSVGLT